MNIYYLYPSKNKKKKFTLENKETGERTNFGAKGMSDYTLHGQEERKQRYIQRHSNEKEYWKFNRNNVMRPAFLSRWLLWNKPSIQQSILDVEQKLGIDIKKKN